MPTVNIVNMTGEVVGEMNLSEKVFGAEVNEAVLHSYVRAYLLNQRQGTQSTLTRTEVSGGGKKPWRQKGSGRARQGSTRSPQWTHGGIVFAPKPRDYRVTLNKKTKRVALYSALSAKAVSGDIVVLDELTVETYKTSEIVKCLKAIGLQKEVIKKYRTDDSVEKAERKAIVPQKTLIVLPDANKVIVKSCDNIPYVTTAQFNNINAYDILNAEKLVIVKAAAEKLTKVYELTEVNEK